RGADRGGRPPAQAAVRAAEPGGDGEAREPAPVGQPEEGHRPHPDRAEQPQAAGSRQVSEAATPTRERSHLRTIIGVVTSDKRDKTRTVAVDYQQRHPKYGKYLRRQAKYQVHDEKNE